MAYTYDNILEEARKAGVLEKLSQEDHTAAQKNPEYGMSLVGLLKDENNATTETQRLLAAETMNQLRKNYGVTGATSASASSSFSGAQRLAAPEKTGTLSSSDPATYQTVLDDIVNQKEFTYDHEQDPTYQAYAKTYLREGARASENALAKAAAMSGGRPSSYALGVAQQVGNQYAAALSDMIPTLRQNAQAEHESEIAGKYDILAALDAKRQDDYQRELDEQNRKRLEVQDALTKYQTLGYATPDVAQLLGVPEGVREITYRTLNQTRTEGGKQWIMVGETPLTQEQIDGAISAQQITATYDNKNGTVTYEWVDGAEEEYNKPAGDPTIANPMGGPRENRWVQIGDSKISMTALEREVLAGRIIGKYDEATNSVTYERIALPGRTGR